jgi:hypothetical protein
MKSMKWIFINLILFMMISCGSKSIIYPRYDVEILNDSNKVIYEFHDCQMNRLDYNNYSFSLNDGTIYDIPISDLTHHYVVKSKRINGND